MTGNIEQKHRRSIRLPDYDYTQPGAYFVTVCAHGNRIIFGDVADGQVRLNELGNIVMQSWQEIPEHFSNVESDEFVIMPNHIHGLLLIHANCRGDACVAPTPKASGPKKDSIGAIIGSFKSAAAKRINILRASPGLPVWQRGYYEHVVRRTDKMNRIREYILDNPLRWEFDPENPQHE